MSIPVVGVGAVILDQDRMLLVRRGSGAMAGRWAVPGGRQRFGETMQVAVAREVREETGLEVEVGELVWAGDAIGPGRPPSWHFVLVDFSARPIGGTIAAGNDAAEVRWVPMSEIKHLDLADRMGLLLEKLGV